MTTHQITSDIQVCNKCRNLPPLEFDFTMAFQPIVDLKENNVFAYEALVRGRNNESAQHVFSKVNKDNRYAFDQSCRVKAIELAVQHDLKARLSINFLPNAIYEPERCLRTTLAAAHKYNFPLNRIMFEFTEVEKIIDSAHLTRIISTYKSYGFATALDDFGAGYSGLSLLADFQPNIVKIDMGLIRNIHTDPVRQKILHHNLALLRSLDIRPIVEGIETREEMQWLHQEQGVTLMQGYYFAKPEFENLPAVDFNKVG